MDSRARGATCDSSCCGRVLASVRYCLTLFRLPDGPAKERLRKTFEELSDIDPAEIGDLDSAEEDGVPFVHFDDEGQSLFMAWDSEHQQRLRGGDLSDAFESHLSKYASMVPSIALLLHLASGGRGPVSRSATALAIRWAKYLESHARRLHVVATSPHRQDVAALVRRLIDWPGNRRTHDARSRGSRPSQIPRREMVCPLFRSQA